MELVTIIHFTKLPMHYHKVHFRKVEDNWYFSYQHTFYIYDQCFHFIKEIEMSHCIEGFDFCTSTKSFLIYNDGFLYCYTKDLLLQQKISIQPFCKQYGIIQEIEWINLTTILCCFSYHLIILSLNHNDCYQEFPQTLCHSINATTLFQTKRYILSNHTIYDNDSCYPIYHNYKIISSTATSEYLYILVYHDCHYILLQYNPCVCNQHHSIACMESNMARILGLEANKIQYALMNKCCIKDIITVNNCVKETIDSVTKLELVLIKRLMTSQNNTHKH